MGISIRNPEVGRLARELAESRGVSMTEAIAQALRNEIARERDKRTAGAKRPSMIERLEALTRKIAAVTPPDMRPLTKDEIDEIVDL